MLPSLGPLAEAIMSLRMLRPGGADPLFEGWRQQVRGLTGLRTDVLRAVMPAREPFFDLISAAGVAGTVARSAERLLASPRADIRVELDYYAWKQGQVPRALHSFDDDLRVRHEVVDSLVSYHDLAVGPRWQRIQSLLTADRHNRALTLFDKGTEGLLATLHPVLRWESPVLTDDSPGAGKDEHHLDGRGLVLAPSFFCRQPMLLRPAGGGLRCMLVYPVLLDPESLVDVWAEPQPGKALSNLLGRTRAAVLSAIGDGPATTSQLAALTGSSAASISQHTSILRGAGLITSHRYRNTVHHMLAAPGSVLLNKS